MESSLLSRRAAVLGATLAFAVVLAACGGGDGATDTTGGDATDTTTGDATTTAPGGASTTAAPAGGGDGTAGEGDTVGVTYTGTLDDGTTFDSNVGGQPLEFTIGSGQVIDGFDQAVTGMSVGETVTVRIPAEDAYGEYDPEATMEFPIADVPEEYREVGVEVPMGAGFSAKVLEVTDEVVILDTNHPLAGEALTFEIELLSIQ